MARLPYINREDLPEDFRYLWDRLGAPDPGDEVAAAVQRLRVENPEVRVPNIFRTLGHNPEIWQQYLRLGNALWTKSGIDTATRELIILRTAILQQSRYEWHQHVRIGRQAGLTDDRIRGLHNWKSTDLYSEPERAILAYADAVASSDGPPEDVHNELARHFLPSTIVAINLITGFYAMTARFLGAMEVETETPFIGWELESA